MTQASNLQKKSRKKYILFALLIIFLIGMVLGLIFILGSNKWYINDIAWIKIVNIDD